MQTESSGPLPIWIWIAFGTAVVTFLTADLASHSRGSGESRRSAAIWSAVWIAAGLGFMGFVWVVLGPRSAEEYLATYLLEKCLSLDNLFLFLVIFRALKIPEAHQRRVLYWGILGAVAFRGVFIFAGVAALRTFDWIQYVLGLLLLYAAWKSARPRPSGRVRHRFLAWLLRHLPVSEGPHEGRFFARGRRGWVVTSSFLALAAIELTDVMFAIDSVAAALAVTRDEFVLYSSNIFAILGLRALYVLLADTLSEFRYLHLGLAAVLAFAALKLLLHEWAEISPLLSVGVIVGLVGSAILASLRIRRAT